MTETSLLESIQRVYDAVARRRPDQPFLNYGFDDLDMPADSAIDDLASGCRRLYEAVLLPFPAAARTVVEVGCGRGGGAAILLEGRPDLRYVGLDLSAEHLALCRQRLASHDAHVAKADAARLPLASGGADVVFSVEALQHFEAPERFYTEAARVLAPGGWLLAASLWRVDLDPTETFRTCGFDVVERTDITPNVVASLTRTTHLREALIDSLDLPERFRPNLMSWAGVRGYGSYEGLASGSWKYLRFRLQKPA